MDGAADRWYLSGPLGVGTAFDEPTDAHSTQGIGWGGVGTAVRHDRNYETLNLLDGRPGAPNLGPNLNLWGLNAGGKAVRLGTVGARFAATADGATSSYLILCAKPAGNDVAEALRVTGAGNVGIGTPNPQARLDVAGGVTIRSDLTVGAGGNGAITVRHVNGKHYQHDGFDSLYLNWGTGKPVVVGHPQALGGLDVFGNLTLQAGNAGIGTSAPGARLHVAANGGVLNLEGTDSLFIQWFPRGGSAGRRAWTGFGNAANTNTFTIQNDSPNELHNPGRMTIYTSERLFLLPREATVIGKEAGGSGNLHVQGSVRVDGPLGTNGYDPRGGFPEGVAGGVHTWDVYAEGAVYAGRGGGVGAAMFHDGTITGRQKRFVIDHPLDPEHQHLVHAAVEGPEAGVYYRGEAQLSDGAAVVTLPDYFEALTRADDRTVQLTPVYEGAGPVSALAASAVCHGRFTVRMIDHHNPHQRFYWEVKAARADVDRLEVERRKRPGHG